MTDFDRQPEPCALEIVDADKTGLYEGELGGATDTDKAYLVIDGTVYELLKVGDAPTAHAATHTDGTDDIQNASNSQKGLATAGQVTALEANTSHKNTTSGNPHQVSKSDVGLGNVTNDAQIAKSIGAAAGDIIYFTASGTPARLAKGSNGQVLTLASGVPAWTDGGIVVDFQYDINTNQASTTSYIPHDNTTPQNTEGSEYLSVTITPKDTSNLLVFEICIQCHLSAAHYACMALFQDSTANALMAQSEYHNGQVPSVYTMNHVMAAGTTSPTTFKVRCGMGAAGTHYLNVTSTYTFGGIRGSHLKVWEIKQT